MTTTLQRLTDERADLIQRAQRISTGLGLPIGRDFGAHAERSDELAKLTAAAKDKADEIGRIKRQLAARQDSETESLKREPILTLRGTVHELEPGSRPWKTNRPEYRKLFRKYLSGNSGVAHELLAMVGGQIGNGPAIEMPPEYIETYFRTLDSLNPIRERATIISSEADEIEVPARMTIPSTGGWTQNLTEPSEDTTQRVGNRVLGSHDMKYLVKASKRLLRSSPNADEIIRTDLASAAAELEEAAHVAGSGAQRPLGAFIANTDGVPTSRDIVTGNATALSYDAFVRAKYALRAPYRRSPSCAWVMAPAIAQAASLLKDGTGQPILRPARDPGGYDLLLNVPVLESDYAPTTLTDGTYVAVIADWSKYIIHDDPTVGIEVLTELLTLKNQTAYVLHHRTDGAPGIAEAFARVKMSA